MAGFFGFTVRVDAKGKATGVDARHRGVVDIDEAHREVADVLAVWRSVSLWPDAQPFTGGVWDAWPKRLAEGVAYLRAESRAVMAYLQHEEAAT